jgi:hypothetical protein
MNFAATTHTGMYGSLTKLGRTKQQVMGYMGISEVCAEAEDP